MIKTTKIFKFIFFATLIIWIIAQHSYLMASDSIPGVATIKNVSGDVLIERGNELITAFQGFLIQEKDILITGKDASTGLIFKDNSVLSMGPESRLEIQNFAFEPAQEKLSFVANMMQGTLTYLSGLITKLKPESVEFRTPSATIGIRGTHIAIEVEGEYSQDQQMGYTEPCQECLKKDS